MSREILVTGFVGDRGAKALYEAHRGELERMFAPGYLGMYREDGKSDKKAAESVKSLISGLSEWAVELDAYSICQGLWALSEALQTGFSVQLREIPVRQEAIEVCNALDADPYSLDSTGCVLFVTEDAAECIRVLREAGMEAVRIGVLRADRKKILLRGDEERFLNRPKGLRRELSVKSDECGIA